MVRVLRQLKRRCAVRLATLDGGTARNAIPREASATLALPAADVDTALAVLGELQASLRDELSGVNCPHLRGVPCAVDDVMDAAEQALWLASLQAVPQGVQRMSARLPGVVETSSNLGIVHLAPDSATCNFMVRSLVDAAGRELGDAIASLFALSAMPVELSGHYPGWTPNPESPLLARCQAVFRDVFAESSTTQVIHAGLECSLIGGKYPGMDMLSFGPTIRSAHAPGEMVDIASVERCWRLLTAILAALD